MGANKVTFKKAREFFDVHSRERFQGWNCHNCPLAKALGLYYVAPGHYRTTFKSKDRELPLWASRFIQDIDSQQPRRITGRQAVKLLDKIEYELKEPA